MMIAMKLRPWLLAFAENQAFSARCKKLNSSTAISGIQLKPQLTTIHSKKRCLASIHLPAKAILSFSMQFSSISLTSALHFPLLHQSLVLAFPCAAARIAPYLKTQLAAPAFPLKEQVVRNEKASKPLVLGGFTCAVRKTQCPSSFHLTWRL